MPELQQPPPTCANILTDEPKREGGMRTIDVLSIQRVSAADRAKIQAIDPAIRLTDAGGWFDGEIRETWPAFTATRYLPPGATGSGTPAARDPPLAHPAVILRGLSVSL